MTYHESPQEDSLHSLKERAKELNCLYQVDELLNNSRLPISDMLKAIAQVIPSGWQYPELCEVRIVYENRSYQTAQFATSPCQLTSIIKADDKPVGLIEVVYTREVPQCPEGYFLEKEHKLIRTIADRIGQTILHRRIKEVLLDWEQPRHGVNERGIGQDWLVIIDLLRRTDPEMLLYVCRKMVNHMFWSGISEAQDLLHDFSPGWQASYQRGETNFPSARLPLGNLSDISKKTFEIAAQHFSDSEISIRLQKWIQEQKAYGLFKTIGRIDTSVGEIIEAVMRYQSIAGNTNLLPESTERWLEVALIRRFLSENLDFIRVAKQYIGISSFYGLIYRLIYPADSHGKIGGKGTGLFLAYQILKKAGLDQPLLASVKVPRTWFITTDEITEFLHYNDLEELNEEKYKDLSEVRMNYPNTIQIMKNSRFPSGLIKSLALALDDLGTSPIIVRSSSLLEDQIGAAFCGKYKSLFLANQGTKEQRLEALMDAIVEVYASLYSPDSIQYRAEKGLLDFHEEMGILIQEVVGTRVGPYYLPLYSGVAFSNNEFRWSPRIRRKDGLIRMVMGLGTRAVDRLNDDFPVLISPGQPGLRVNKMPDEIKHYAPKNVDVINLENNRFETIPIRDLLRKYGADIPSVHHLVCVKDDDYMARRTIFDIDFQKDDLIVTFDGLISDTSFIKKVSLILETLQEKLGFPVDIEFASDGKNFYLLQCRPQSDRNEDIPAAIPKDMTPRDIVFSANRYISNGTIRDISYIVYVDPEAYYQLEELDQMVNVGKAVGLINSLLPRKRFILMGPGRWGSRGDIRLGVLVNYADISNTAALIEIAKQKHHYVPELSFGTHFFQDLVENNIRYLPLYPDDKSIIFNESFLRRSPSILASLLPEYDSLKEVVRVIDVQAVSRGNAFHIAMNADLEQALGYLAPLTMQTQPINNELVLVEKVKPGVSETVDDRFWRWRFYMAEKVAEKIDMERFGVQGIYLIGSTNNGTAGPGSDIDLLIHVHGTPQQQRELEDWINGWSEALAAMNYLKTGYQTEGLLDVHYITDQDISEKNSFAIKIGAITDPAHPLRII